MGTFLNSHWWVGDLTLFEALAGGAFDHLNCQHTGEFDQNFSKKSNVPYFARRRMNVFGIHWYTLRRPSITTQNITELVLLPAV